MEQKESILEVKNLSVTLDGRTIVEDVSFTVEQGQALAVIGPNGAGKTMLFRALLGLVPSHGHIKWSEGAEVGYVPQRLPLPEYIPLTVKEFFLLKSPRFWFPEKKLLAHIHHEFTLVGLHDRILSRKLTDLSGGEFQRLLIAWAMTTHPTVLLFDEPTAGIDVGFEETIYTVMRKLQKERGTTILLISHDLDVVYRYAQEVLCINKKMICYGKPSEVLHPKELAKLYGEGGFYKHVKK